MRLLRINMRRAGYLLGDYVTRSKTLIHWEWTRVSDGRSYTMPSEILGTRSFNTIDIGRHSTYCTVTVYDASYDTFLIIYTVPDTVETVGLQIRD